MLIEELRNSCFFRYRNFNDNTLDEILTGNVWHSKPSLLNDPFEFNFEFDWANFTIDNFVQINNSLGIFPQHTMENLYLGAKNLRYQIFDKLETEVRRVIVERKEEMESIAFICCFASSPDNPLMWSHYSNGMQGLCIAYNRDTLAKSEDFKRIIPVEYVDSPYQITHEHLQGELISFQTTPVTYDFSKRTHTAAEIELTFNVHFKSYKYMFQKHLRWNYEGEHRSLAVSPASKNAIGCLKNIGSDSISAIIFGHRMSKTNINILELICRNKEIKMFKATPRRSDFSVTIEEHIF
ncbi:DUF2971 domain-containing protein [Vibrio fluvialis]|nr:DUF2971 domain-containing protein [Vibrio fluvialis]